MTEYHKEIHELYAKLEILLQKQNSFREEILALRRNIQQLEAKIDKAPAASGPIREEKIPAAVTPAPAVAAPRRRRRRVRRAAGERGRPLPRLNLSLNL